MSKRTQPTPETPAPTEPDQPTTLKRPRTESPETIAMRAVRTRRQLQERRDKAKIRHAQRMAEFDAAIEQHNRECSKLPQAALEIFEKLVG